MPSPTIKNIVLGKRKAFGKVKPNWSNPKIDWGHPLAYGLLFCGYDVGDGRVLDLYGGTEATAVGTAVSLNDGPYGRSLLYNNNGGRYWASSTAVRSATAAAPYSWACVCVKTDVLGAYSRPFGRTANNGGAAPYANWDFEGNPGGRGQGTLCLTVSDNGNSGASADWTGLADNTFTSLVGVATSSTSFSLYAQGALINTTAATAIQSVDTNDAILFSGASAAASVAPWAGPVFIGLFWNRALNADEITLFYNHPYCFLTG